MVKMLSIGQLAARTGESVKTLRYWTDLELLEAQRRENGYRFYQPEMVERVAFIRAVQTLGFKLAEIKAVFALRTEGIPPCTEAKAKLEAHLSAVRKRIGELQRLRTELEARLQWAETHPELECDTEGCVYLAPTR